jgi:hypothetical protein
MAKQKRINELEKALKEISDLAKIPIPQGTYLEMATFCNNQVLKASNIANGVLLKH